MKKNTMMRLAAVMLMCVLLTTSVVGGTFAKYVTKNGSTDTARVAEFGVVIDAITADTNDLFVKTYNADASDYSGITVEAEVDVVAPGTKGEMTKFTITGTPEVAVRVTYTPTLTLEGWKIDASTEYCPIVFEITKDGTKTTYGTNDTNATNKSVDVAALITDVQEAIKGASKDYAPNTNLGETGVAVNNDLVVSWYWLYEVDAATDTKDTILGKLAAEGQAPTIKLDLTVTITQID